jgi:hypothetical protein
MPIQEDSFPQQACYGEVSASQLEANEQQEPVAQQASLQQANNQ